MENIATTPFIDFVTHLQEILDNEVSDTFEVSSVRNMNTNNKKISVVVTALAGSVYSNSARLPYFIEVISNKPDDIINIFTKIARQQNNQSFIAVAVDGEETHEYTVYEFYTTPSIVDKDNEYDINHKCRLVMYATLDVLFEVGNVSKIKINNEELDFQNGVLAYATEKFSIRHSGERLSGAIQKTATTSLQISMVNKISTFTNNLFSIMFGRMDGNTIFNCEITLTNGITANLPMTLDSNSLNFAKNTPNLPSLSVVLTLALED